MTAAKEPLRIVFMGTPEFAVPSLQVLVENGYEVVAVVTAPDKPAGRGLKLTPSPVKAYAVSQNIPVLQPTNLKDPDFQQHLRDYHANLFVVVAFRMLPEAVWSMPAIGTFNLHASLLPQYRGAAPVNRAVMNGETETGVTTFFLQHEIDTGGIILQEKEPIHENDTAGTLYERLMQKGAQLVLKTVQLIETGTYTVHPQDTSKPLKGAPKIFKETCRIDWNQPSDKVYNFIRGLAPYPGAWTLLHGKLLKIYQARVAGENKGLQPGATDSDNKTYLHFQAADGMIAVDTLQLEGKKRMDTESFLRGYSETI